jgi:hypothetical protein
VASALAICAWTGCKDDAKPADTPVAATAGSGLEPRCDQLAKACGDNAKHTEKIAVECKQVAAKQWAKNCVSQASVVYDCYEKELCAKGDKVWALDDLRVLSDRHTRCVAERNLLRTCVGDAP